MLAVPGFWRHVCKARELWSLSWPLRGRGPIGGGVRRGDPGEQAIG